MMRATVLALALATGALMPAPVMAVQPNEVLSDPALESRARALSKDLRCLVCRNENIDDSNADLARDLRLLVRERLVAGDSDSAAMDYIVARYGEYVLLNPTSTGANLLLWYAGPLMLLVGGGIAFTYVRRRRTLTETAPATLSTDEEKRLAEIMRE
ncbi:cytochrome c-type biogenesis protein CcmH [Pseudorhodobacter antarcticus]|jgi:cytochrome c-type biogenesis protein CcmH|uniref:Cytochrome c-type biogenesis protein n=2 Tax=Pseudorhodobacter antarcticus TaxID=1077947 RepID=A0A1H8DQR8_9RHOB|nr:cytochrome c-type biogenesis protein CcmH [Pseudorhodobacter antarcticus]